MSSLTLNVLLKRYGLIYHTFAFNELPTNIKSELGDDDKDRYQDCYLSLIANAGPRFWKTLKTDQATWTKDDEAFNNPVDFFSIKIIEQILQLTGLSINAELLYPGTAPAPLILLGELANWSTPSPLGLGLHKRYGPWFAYRALIKTTRPLQSHSETEVVAGNSATQSPCLSCTLKPCVSACPSNAVSATAVFDIARCADYRVKEHSKCKTQCHARNACPVGRDYRYSDEQCAYHMTHALDALVRWASKT